MRAVRCDVCGAKAMIAAGKCPGCGHLFALRDGFGELPPLAYCSSCDSYYPESLGSCRWCGTQPARPPITPRVWYTAGAVVGVVIVVLLLLRNGTSQDGPRSRTVTTRPVVATAPLDNDTAVARAVTPATDNPPSPTVAVTDPVARDPSPTAMATNTSVATASASIANATKSVEVAPASKRPATHWVRTVSRHWVVVRTGPSRASHVVASIGPNSRVELGEFRGSWRRVRAKGISGWVEPRTSFELVASR